jgi:hypothetical protein
MHGIFGILPFYFLIFCPVDFSVSRKWRYTTQPFLRA